MQISNILKTIRFANVSEVAENPLASASIHIKNYNGNMTTSTTDIDDDDDSLSGIDRIYHHHVHVPVPFHNQEEQQFQQRLQQHHQFQQPQPHPQLQQHDQQIPFLSQFYHPQMDLTFGTAVNPYAGGAAGGGIHFPHGYVTNFYYPSISQLTRVSHLFEKYRFKGTD